MNQSEKNIKSSRNDFTYSGIIYLCLMFRSFKYKDFIRLFDGWLVGFYGISTSVGYLTPNPFLYNKNCSNNSVR